VKTTIEIADSLFERAQNEARKRKTTFRALTEEGLRLALAAGSKARPKRVRPLVTLGKAGGKALVDLSDWDRLRDAIYNGRGA
jgi:hypothetical protein